MSTNIWPVWRRKIVCSRDCRRARSARCWSAPAPDWRGLLVNLYAPVAANVLARTLLGGEGLTLSDGEIGALRERWEHVRPERIENDLLTAADALAERLALPRGAGKYLSSCAREVAVRAESLRDCGGLRGLFV